MRIIILKTHFCQQYIDSELMYIRFWNLSHQRGFRQVCANVQTLPEPSQLAYTIMDLEILDEDCRRLTKN